MINKKKRIIAVILIFLILASIWFFANNLSSSNSFTVHKDLIESKIKVGGSISNNIEIFNGKRDNNFEINLVGFDRLAVISENEFYLGSSESRTIQVFFNDSALVLGSYIGYLSIKNKVEEKKIPIILSIETELALFKIDLEVAPENKQLNKGGTTKTNLKFISLKDTNPHTVLLNYEIRNLEGKLIISEQKETIITFSSLITKTIDLPEDIERGSYIFTVSLTYGKSFTSSSYLFSVDSEKKYGQFFTIWTALIFILFFVFFVFILIGYMFYERNKLFSRLKIQQANQIKFCSNQINRQKKKSLAGVKIKKERQKILRKFKEAKKKIINKIKREQIKQKEDFERIRKEKGDKAVEKKINDWKRSGYPNVINQLKLSQGLKIKLIALEKAYNLGYVSKKSYNKGKERIDNVKRRLKRNLYK